MVDFYFSFLVYPYFLVFYINSYTVSKTKKKTNTVFFTCLLGINQMTSKKKKKPAVNEIKDNKKRFSVFFHGAFFSPLPEAKYKVSKS
jgi:hypothetical protein